MRRRTLNGGILGAAAAFALPKVSHSYIECRRDDFGQAYCDVGIRTADFRRVRAYQDDSFWCWAASLQMVFRWLGRNCSQRSIVEQTYGSAINVPMDPMALMQSTKRSYVDDQGARFYVESNYLFNPMFATFELDNRTVVQTLRRERPLIICNHSHMMVLVGVSYLDQRSWQPSIREAWVADPWPFQHWPRGLPQGFRYLSDREIFPAPLGGDLVFLSVLDVG